MHSVFVRTSAAVLLWMWMGACSQPSGGVARPPKSPPALFATAGLRFAPSAAASPAIPPQASSQASSQAPSQAPSQSSPQAPPQASPQSAPPSGPATVGSDICQGCHEQAGKTLRQTAHRRLLAEDAPAGQGCEGCHGPGSEHVDGGGDTAKIFRFAKASADEVRTRCQACHPMNPKGAHDRKQIACTRCHSLHRPMEQKGLLAKPEDMLCRECHS